MWILRRCMEWGGERERERLQSLLYGAARKCQNGGIVAQRSSAPIVTVMHIIYLALSLSLCLSLVESTTWPEFRNSSFGRCYISAFLQCNNQCGIGQRGGEEALSFCQQRWLDSATTTLRSFNYSLTTTTIATTSNFRKNAKIISTLVNGHAENSIFWIFYWKYSFFFFLEFPFLKKNKNLKKLKLKN